MSHGIISVKLAKTVSLLLIVILVVSVATVAFNPSVIPIGEVSAQGGGQGQQPLHISFKYTYYWQSTGCSVYCETDTRTGSFTSSAILQPSDDWYVGNGTGHYEHTVDEVMGPFPPVCPQGGSYHELTSGPALMEVDASPVRLNYTVRVVFTGETLTVTSERHECGKDESQAYDIPNGTVSYGCDFYEVDLAKGGTYELFDTLTEGSVCIMTISPVKEELRIFGTATGIIERIGIEPISSSKVVIANIDDTPYLEALSKSKPDFFKETATSDDKEAKYEFKFDREDRSKLPRILVVSVLWYEGKPEFGVTNGKNVSGTYVPVYQALCVDDVPNTKCEKWKKTNSGNYEAEVNFEYGSLDKRIQSTTVMHDEDWEGSTAIHRMMMEAAHIYYKSYLAMKYFESLGLGFPSNPLMIKTHHIGADCPDLAAWYDPAAKFSGKLPSFGDLGQYLDKVQATGAGVYLCDNESRLNLRTDKEYTLWHEIGHYLHFEMYDPYGSPIGVAHFGYKNDGTNDSVIEGFATFVAMLIGEHYGKPHPYVQFQTNLEEDLKVWDDLVTFVRQADGSVSFVTDTTLQNFEEFAVAGILWDFHDRGTEIDRGFFVNGTLVKVSKVYPDSIDQVSVDAKTILQVIKRNEPKTLVDIYNAFVGNSISQVDTDMIFVNHGAFADTVDRNLVHDTSSEKISETGHTPDRMIRKTPPHERPGSNLESNIGALFNVTIIHDEPFGYYDYSYLMDMPANVPVYFTMSPQYYPSKAIITPISSEGEKLSGGLEIDSDEYWNYILSDPPQDSIFKRISVEGISGANGSVTALQYIQNTKDLLSRASAEYKQGNVTGAEELARTAYLDNFENVETDLVQRNATDLKEQTEQMLRVELVGLIRDRAESDIIDDKIAAINGKLDEAIVIVPEFPPGFAIATLALVIAIAAISAKYMGKVRLGSHKGLSGY